MSPKTSLPGTELILLAGGLGTRIRSVLGDTPKILAPVDGSPLLAWLLPELARAGFVRVVLALGYRSDAVTAFLAHPRAGWPAVRVTVEPEPRGTGGALREALPLTDGATVAAMNGDTLVDLDWDGLRAEHARYGAAVTLAVTRVPDAARFGTVEADADGVVSGFAEKRPDAGAAEVSLGCYLLDRAVLEAIPAGRAVSLERDVLPGLIGRGLRAARCARGFLDLGTPESYREAARYVRAIGWREPAGPDR